VDNWLRKASRKPAESETWEELNGRVHRVLFGQDDADARVVLEA
jgi:hypothetical protein